MPTDLPEFQVARPSALLDLLGEVLLAFDAEGRVVAANAAAEGQASKSMSIGLIVPVSRVSVMLEYWLHAFVVVHASTSSKVCWKIVGVKFVVVLKVVGSFRISLDLKL